MSSMPDFMPRGDHPDFRWQRGTMLRLACYCLPLIDQGETAFESLQKAQQFLDENKRHTLHRLAGVIRRPQWPDALRAARAMPEAERAMQVNALMAGLSTTSDLSDDELDEQANGNRSDHATERPGNVVQLASRVVWDDTAWKLVQRRVEYLRIHLGDLRLIADIVDSAQRTELPQTRWRALSGLKAALYLPPDKVGNLHNQLERAKGLPDSLLDAYPFDASATPDQPAPYVRNPPTAPTAPPAPPAPAPNLPGPRARRVPRAPGPSAMAVAMQTALVEPPQAPEPAPPEPPPKPLRTAQEPPKEVPAPLPPAPPVRAVQRQPISVFGEAFGEAMTSMMNATAENLLANMEKRVMAMSQHLVRGAIQAAIHEITQAVPKLVAATLAEQLGGDAGTVPSVESVIEHEEAPADEHAHSGDIDPDEIIKLDVIGLLQAQCAEVKKHLGLYGTGVRYIDANQASRWTPRAVVVVNYKFVDRQVERTLRGTTSKVIKVHGGTTAVINAIRNLYEEQGVELPT